MSSEGTPTPTPAAPAAASATPATTDYWGSWFSTAKQQALEIASKAQELAENAGKVVQEQASTIAHKAQELRENYDLEVATSILMSTVGGPVSPTAGPLGEVDLDSLPLSKQDLAQLDMVYVTENLISMAFPRDKTKEKGRKRGGEGGEGCAEEGNDINVVAAYLRRKHQGRFMIWNISEESYDYRKFAEQVLEYRFPGHPAPPLGLLFKICTSIESWLDADAQNVAVVHCLTGKGRTATLLACVLTWMGEFDSPLQALQYIATRRGTDVDSLTIPSQRRYVQYFSNLLDGVRPSAEPLVLRRVVMNAMPCFGQFAADDENTRGCCPYIQLFKNGKLIATAAAYTEKTPTPSEGERESDKDKDNSGAPKLQLRWVNASEGSASFRVDCPVQGDILLRCRHASVSGNRARVSMFRAAFHTGYISGGVLRLSKAQLDGAASDTRFSEDFFIDLVFAPLSTLGDASSSSTAPSLSVSAMAKSTSGNNIANNAAILPEAAEADRYESSIHKDARFWESVAQRKVKAKRRRPRKFVASQQEPFSIADEAVPGRERERELASMTEIRFLARDAQLQSEQQSQEAYRQDRDLIKQLAELEGDVSLSEEGETKTEIESKEDALSHTEKEKENSQSSKSLPAPASSLAAPQTPMTTPSVKGELQALEDLEKELGLSDLQLFSSEKSKPSTTISRTQTPAKSFPEDDNLDELEKYLQSLSSN